MTIHALTEAGQRLLDRADPRALPSGAITYQHEPDGMAYIYVDGKYRLFVPSEVWEAMIERDNLKASPRGC